MNNPLINAARVSGGSAPTSEIVGVNLTLPPSPQDSATLRGELDAQTRDVASMREQIRALEQQRLILGGAAVLAVLWAASR